MPKRSENRRAPFAKKRRSTPNPATDHALVIPTFNPDSVMTCKVRYGVDLNASTDVIAWTNELPVAPFALSSSSSNLYIPFKAVRISKIEMWANYRPALTMLSNTINLTCNTREGVRPIEWSGTASYTRMAHIEKSFPPTQPIGQWYITTNGVANPEFTFQMGKGSVLEITYCYILSDEAACGTYSSSGLSFPRIYFNKLNADVDVFGKSHETLIVM